MTSSYQQYLRTPSALLFDGYVPIPLWAVSQLSIEATYALPQVGSGSRRVALPAHDDAIALTAVLLGPERFAWKTALEGAAEASRFGTALSPKRAGLGAGLILVTAATVRTHLAVQSLTFTLSAARRDTVDVTMRLLHLPPPGTRARLLDAASIAVGALGDVLPR